MSGQIETKRALKCCGGWTDGTKAEHEPSCPNIVRAALSWIEETSVGERHRKRGLAAFDLILAERDALREALRHEVRQRVAREAAYTEKALGQVVDDEIAAVLRAPGERRKS